MSQITTHILDTSRGIPASGVRISLQSQKDTEWEDIGSGITNEDGRVSDLLAEDVVLTPGYYRMLFYVGEYFQNLNVHSFYPEVSVVFEVLDQSHYHVPLLLNPYGYSTYRGS